MVWTTSRMDFFGKIPGFLVNQLSTETLFYIDSTKCITLWIITEDLCADFHERVQIDSIYSFILITVEINKIKHSFPLASQWLHFINVSRDKISHISVNAGIE